MAGTVHSFDLDRLMIDQWLGQPEPPSTLLEERVLELEQLGMSDMEEMPGIPSSARQFALATLRHHKPLFFITFDDNMLINSDALEARYGVKILSVSEAILLLRDSSGPPN